MNQQTQSDAMQYDVVIVGAGPAGLTAAIHLLQLSQQHNHPLRVCILEKGAQVGAHILSGAVLNLRTLKTLLPDTWQNAPLDAEVTQDQFYYLSAKHAVRLPTPKQMKNHGHRLVRLGLLCQFLASEAEKLGCDIYPGFAATDLLYDTNGRVVGVSTGPMGIDKAGQKTANYQPGMPINATYTLFAEGCRGELSQRLMEKFDLREGVAPQTYGLGIKEVWRVAPEKHHEGRVIHTVGWPLDTHTYGGSFIYHLSSHQVALGFVVGLDYQNPWLDPFGELQRFKTHPLVSSLLEGGERIAYGARALNEGGWQSIPTLTFPGGALIGDAAGFLNVPQIKGIHTAMESGRQAAKAVIDNFINNPTSHALTQYADAMNQSWVTKELYKARNIRPGFRYGLWAGLLNAAFETYITRGHSPWTLTHYPDYAQLKPADECPKIDYPQTDNKLSSVYLSNTYHVHQPPHLILKDPTLAIDVNAAIYASPETRYCPAAVYEMVNNELTINAQNCLHCKACSIKDPRQNIIWTAPEGGGGPQYAGM